MTERDRDGRRPKDRGAAELARRDHRPDGGGHSDDAGRHSGGRASVGSDGIPGDGVGTNGTSDMDRRTALKVIAAGSLLGTAPACGTDRAAGTLSDHERLSGFAPLPPSNPLATGSATDPDLLSPSVPWEGVLADEELRLVAALADLILPADERSPAASAVGVPDYVNEYVSAPYPAQRHDLVTVRGGLAWLNRQAKDRFEADFPDLTQAQQSALCDPISYEADAPEALKPQARFFDLFRDVCSTGYWTTEEGMRDLGYVGNVPLPAFDGPPTEVLDLLGLGEEDLG